MCEWDMARYGIDSTDYIFHATMLGLLTFKRQRCVLARSPSLNLKKLSIRNNHSSLENPSARLFHKILIANRGEIACRVIRTAKRLGIKTVAVYSDSDIGSNHVLEADEAVHIGLSPASQSYLVGQKIIDACLKTGAQAVHPGYGFLSENLQFCQQCEDNNIVFIGPTPYAIRAMGSKSESKDIMIKAGVPVTPGYHGSDQSNDNLLKQADRIGFPLMIKAVSGGGGKGMRAVFERSTFLEDLESCRREAQKSFNDSDVLLEKLIRAPRHVEFQIFGDSHGNAVHLMERDCSVQRRHQKVLEEAPAPTLSADRRQAMGDAAVKAALAVGYRGAGTVEFLIDSVTNDFYFCEMNTRLQVEHPVTEMITGTDLVEWQLRVAAGGHLPLSQQEILQRVRGCAIEARIYAENPLKDFLPASGPLHHLRVPTNLGDSNNVRVDLGVRSGNTVTTFYDPMIAKLICYGQDRTEALRRLELALRDFQVAGMPNNVDFLVKCVRHPTFIKGDATTAFFEHHMTELLDSLKPNANNDGSVSMPHALAGVVWTHLQHKGTGIWGKGADWRNMTSVTRNVTLQHALADPVILDVSSAEGGIYTTAISGSKQSGKSSLIKVLDCQIKPTAGNHTDGTVTEFVVEIDGLRVTGTSVVFKTATATNIDIWINGRIGDSGTHFQFSVPIKDFSASSNVKSNPIVLSPMPAKVVKLTVKDGDSVKQGQTIAILEAMKMEINIAAPRDGVIALLSAEGDTVSEGTKLAEINA